MLHIICALAAEAKPLIEAYELKYLGDDFLFPIYADRANNVTLTVSGMGKLSAAAATAYSYSTLDARPNDIWINIGLGGHESLNIGEIVLANSIRDKSSQRCWYPQILVANKIRQAGVLTIDTPSQEYESLVFDMEASGFMNTCSRLAFLELTHCIKVISDNKKKPLCEFDITKATALIQDNIDSIRHYISQIGEIAAQLENTIDIKSELEYFRSICHFSTYETLELKRMLSRWQVLGLSQDVRHIVPDNKNSAKQILEHLEIHMDKQPMRFSAGN